jgi:transcription-repair coupling factor (superfamily II helicase)
MKIISSKFNFDASNIVGLNSELKAMYCYELLKKKNKGFLVVTNSLYEANTLYQYINNYTEKVLLFPMDNFLTSEVLASSPELKIKRIETLIELSKNNNYIVITNLMGYLKYLPDKDRFLNDILDLKAGMTFNFNKLVESLVELGYEKETLVEKTGDFAVRGFVIDIYPVSMENPVRLEFFDDEIESIRIFDVNTQLSLKKLDQIYVYPNTDNIIVNSTQNSNVRDFLDSDLTVFNDYDEIKLGYEETLNEIVEYNISQGLEKDKKYMFSLEELFPGKYINFVSFDNLNLSNKKIYDVKDFDNFFKDKLELNNTLKKYIKNKKTIIVCLDNRYQLTNLEAILDNDNIIVTNEDEIFDNKINLIIKKINDSFECENYIIISSRHIFNTKDKNIKYKSNFRIGTKIKNIDKLNPGDYIVHYAHGIGRYLGLTTLNKNGLKKDYLQIEYKDGDKLYIPVEKIELITKYSSGDGIVPKLNKLNGTEWQKTKLRVKKKVESIAGDLIKLYAERENTQGFAFVKDDKNQLEFENEFEFTPTEDQLKASEEIKHDMERIVPMDRLLCGDVGYGKTEVAFRAIFKAVLSGKQVAFLCPTTILSNQHYKNALERFKNYPINIALLNRFVSAKETTKILEGLKEGKIDVVFGTHKLLNDQISYKDLGLLIIDEEQRFGVKHKERIKQIKSNIDVLTLSATPIPRTLQMSMSGIKNLSVIETPPVDRLPVQTYVLSENNQIIKDAIHKELARQGQVFILYNKINNMDEKIHEIQKLVPEARITSAHGQMDKTELENIMMAFINKESDVLICTTIIETGIDIPNVNTLIVIDADRFGLSQLYQLRGRVGRSNRIAYCYLMYNKHKILSEVAEKRLKAIKEFTELGSGFAIAKRDLSIRGAGDILGSEQSGFIDSVGIDMFMKLLDDEINRQKGIVTPETNESETLPLIEVTTNISDNYVKEDDLKIYIHKLINNINNIDELNDVQNQLEDRFGKLNEDIIIYMYEELFEKKAKKLGIKDIKQNKNNIEIWLPLDLTNKIKIDDLFINLSKVSRKFRFGMRFKRLVITLDIVNLDKHFIYYLIDLLNILEKA